MRLVPAKLRYLAGFGAGLALGLLLVATVVAAGAGVLDPVRQESGWTAWLRDRKHALLAREAAPGRLVVVAGSNALFGIDAAELQRLTAHPAVNAASHVGVRLRLVARAPLGLLRAGDIALLPLEYAFYGQPDSLNQLTIEVGHQEGLGFFRSLPLAQEIGYLRSLQPGFLVEQIRRRFASGGPLPTHGYWGFGVSETGDLDLAAAVPAPDVVRDRAAAITGISTAIRPEFRAMACRTIGDLTARGVRVIGTPDNVYLVHDRAIRNRRALLRKASALFRACGGEWLPVEKDGLQPLGSMLDTEFHPDREGRAERTRLLAAALCERVLPSCPVLEAP